MKNYTRINKSILLILLSSFVCISSLAGPRSYAQAKAIAEKQAAKLGIQIDENSSPACKAKSLGGGTSSQAASYYVLPMVKIKVLLSFQGMIACLKLWAILIRELTRNKRTCLQLIFSI